jgi:hypothetical protein
MRRVLLIAAVAVGAVACAIAPRRIENPPVGPLPDSQRIEVWKDGSRTMVRRLTVDGDSLRAVPEPEPVDCDSCQVHYAVSEVDSLRYPRNDHAAAVATAVPIAVLSAVTFIWGMAASN